MSGRDCLPQRRHSYTQKVRIGGQTVYLSCGLYPDDQLGEIFIDMARQGAALRFWAHGFARLFSIALQHGVPLAVLVESFVGSQSLPSGPVEGHERITQCTSVADYVVRSLALDFLGRDDLADRDAVAASRPEIFGGDE